MPVNAHPDYLTAEKEYLLAETKEQKIVALKKMISHVPGHKGAENLRAQLKRRLARLKYANEKEIKQKKGGKQGIKKEDMQAVIVGFTNTGKSSLLSLLTNAAPKIADYDFTTKEPIIGMMNYAGTQIQLIEIPAFKSIYYDKGLVNTADVILIIITNLKQIEEIKKYLENAHGKRIIIFNDTGKKDLRKISATLSSKKYNYILLPTLKDITTLEKLKEKIFQSFDKIRIYTKEPGKEPDKKRPLILEPNSIVKHVANKIIRNLENLKETKIWGPSSKFPGQVVGLQHELKDLDIIEFKTK